LRFEDHQPLVGRSGLQCRVGDQRFAKDAGSFRQRGRRAAAQRLEAGLAVVMKSVAQFVRQRAELFETAVEVARIRLSSSDMTGMQYAPPRLPSRGPASIHRESKAVLANSAISWLKLPNFSTMKSQAADQVKCASASPSGAKMSHQASFLPLG
jgi:hypothetical protein